MKKKKFLAFLKLIRCTYSSLLPCCSLLFLFLLNDDVLENEMRIYICMYVMENTNLIFSHITSKVQPECVTERGLIVENVIEHQPIFFYWIIDFVFLKCNNRFYIRVVPQNKTITVKWRDICAQFVVQFSPMQMSNLICVRVLAYLFTFFGRSSQFTDVNDFLRLQIQSTIFLSKKYSQLQKLHANSFFFVWKCSIDLTQNAIIIYLIICYNLATNFFKCFWIVAFNSRTHFSSSAIKLIHLNFG